MDQGGSLMGKFRVRVFREIVVEAPDRLAAARVVDAAKFTTLDDPPMGVPHFVVEGTPVVVVGEDVRVGTYTCTRCGEPSMKELWGPGRIFCPRCKRMERPGHEQRALEQLAQVAGPLP
jgi:hypothetical protein